jgi:hypothetical protein
MMNRRSPSSNSSHPASYSKLPTTEQQVAAAAERDIAVVAEYVTAVATTEQQPTVVSLLRPNEATSIAQGLTWTDDFFEVAEHNNSSSDIVAVFDYDQEKLKKINEDDFVWIRCCVTVLFLVAFCWSLLAVESQLFIYLTVCVFLLIAMCGWISNVEKTTVVHNWMHTAVTRTGLRHVQTRPSPDHLAFALDIPFEDIVSIKRTQQTPGGVLLTLASTDDGVEYITSGDCYFQRSGLPPQLYLALFCLKEPVIFMKLLKAMKEEKSAAATKSSSSKRLGAELLCRAVERILDGSDHLPDPSVEHTLRELVVEMRENSSNQSSSIEQQHGVATIV